MTELAVVIAAGGPTGMTLAGELALAWVDAGGLPRRARQGTPSCPHGSRHHVPGVDPAISSLIAEVELAEEPEWGIRRAALGIRTLSKMGAGDPVRCCDVL
jgi:hypothetical protein